MTQHRQPRTFASKPATRERTPILVGLIGPSGTGKTYSALRLAAGFQRVNGGDTYVIDTEARRALHYADRFRFVHVPFGAPFSPLDYLDAVNYCVGKGATTIIIDSMSHEHEGPGGVLEWHANAHAEMGGNPKTSMLAWQKPKAARRRLINSLLQVPCNFIFCFRAKEKMKMVPGKDPVPLGFMPIAGEEFVFEMTLKCLLLPGANGFPTWAPGNQGEKMMVKLPEQFRGLFESQPQLTEDIGEKLATWAAGEDAPETLTVEQLVERYDACADAATYRQLGDAARVSWPALDKAAKARVTTASKAAKARMDAAQTASETAGDAPPITPEEAAAILAREAAEADPDKGVGD